MAESPGQVLPLLLDAIGQRPLVRLLLLDARQTVSVVREQLLDCRVRRGRRVALQQLLANVREMKGQQQRDERVALVVGVEEDAFFRGVATHRYISIPGSVGNVLLVQFGTDTGRDARICALHTLEGVYVGGDPAPPHLLLVSGGLLLRQFVELALRLRAQALQLFVDTPRVFVHRALRGDAEPLQQNVHGMLVGDVGRRRRRDVRFLAGGEELPGEHIHSRHFVGPLGNAARDVFLRRWEDPEDQIAARRQRRVHVQVHARGSAGVEPVLVSGRGERLQHGFVREARTFAVI